MKEEKEEEEGSSLSPFCIVQTHYRTEQTKLFQRRTLTVAFTLKEEELEEEKDEEEGSSLFVIHLHRLDALSHRKTKLLQFRTVTVALNVTL